MKYKNNTVIKSLAYKFTEQLLTKGTSLVVNIVLARLLDVKDFGVVAILTVFTNLCSAVIEGGLSTSLIQKTEVDDKDYSTVFYTSMALAVAMYGALFFCAPFIANIYDMSQLTLYLRVIGLILFTTPFNATQLGYVYRNMLFKKLLISTVVACLVSGGLGIFLATVGTGVWALIAQVLSNSVVAVFVLFIQIPWRPKLLFSFDRLKMHFSYGWKLLVSSIVDTLYVDIQALVIGKKYSDVDLAYYNRGDTYPKTIINSLNTAVQTVMLPVLSAEQSDKNNLKKVMRNTVAMSSFFLFPVMAGFAGVAEGFVQTILGEKWLPCVPYLQLACLAYAVRPINSCNLQAIKAIGRSDIFLWLTLIKKTIGISIVVITAFCFKTPLAIAIGVAVYAPVELLINSFPNRKLIGYRTLEQIKDIALPMIMSLIMFAIVVSMNMLDINVWFKLILQVGVGAAIYLGLSLIFKVKVVTDIISRGKALFRKGIKK